MREIIVAQRTLLVPGINGAFAAEQARIVDKARDTIRQAMKIEAGGGGLMGMPLVPPFTWEPVAAGEITLFGQPCRVLATPGHSPGGRSYYFPQARAVFVGDLLFYRSIGRSDLPGGNVDDLLAAVTSQIFTLPPETAVYPGHGPATTVGDERERNPFFAEFAS